MARKRATKFKKKTVNVDVISHNVGKTVANSGLYSFGARGVSGNHRPVDASFSVKHSRAGLKSNLRIHA